MVMQATNPGLGLHRVLWLLTSLVLLAMTCSMAALSVDVWWTIGFGCALGAATAIVATLAYAQSAVATWPRLVRGMLLATPIAFFSLIVLTIAVGVIGVLIYGALSVGRLPSF